MKDFKLDNHQKISSGFKAPENYFEDLPQTVMRRVAEKPVISIFSKYKIYFAAAAILLLALLVPTFLTQKSELDAATLESYLAYSDISQFDLLTEMSTEEISAMQLPVSDDEIAIEDILTTNSNLEQLILE